MTFLRNKTGRRLPRSGNRTCRELAVLLAETYRKDRKMKKFGKLDRIPSGRSKDIITEGCMVLEGGGWKGLYTLGVLDYLMQHDINLQSTVGISAGSLAGVGYVTGQIGWGARVNLTYRHDKNYIGAGAVGKDHGVTGFTYLFHDILREYPVDKKRLYDDSKRFAVGTTNMLSGETEYFEKGQCRLTSVIRASSTVPFVSRPVVMHSIPYLDGGCSTKIPYRWAADQGYEKIVVVKTREWDFVRSEEPMKSTKIWYHKYPNFMAALNNVNADFNVMTKELKELHEEKKVFVIAPSKPVTVTRFEADMGKLWDLYKLGYGDARNNIGALKEYLGI